MKKLFKIFLIPIFILGLFSLFINFAKADTCSSFTYSDWSACASNGQQTRTVTTSSPDGCTDGSPMLTQNCTYETPVCTSWTYSDWGPCQLKNEWDQGSGYQTRTTTTLSPEGCVFYSYNPLVLSRSCLMPCKINDYECFEWSSCSKEGTQTRNCRLKQRSYNCGDGSEQPQTSQTCTYAPPTCTSFYYSAWSECSKDGKQTRNITSKYPSDCEGGVSPVTTLSCTYSSSGQDKCAQIAADIKYWLDYDKGPINPDGFAYSPAQISSMLEARHNTVVAWVKKLLSLTLTYNCDSSTSNQNQQQTTSCSADTWSCGDWGTCSPQGIQTRSCNKTFNCSSVETASPATSQYCVAPNQPQQQTPTENLGIVNQDSIVKATVKLICPVNNTMASQGSGTIIDASGTILTNKHVIDGTAGCLVGFVDNYNNEPYFGDRQIADIYKISNDADIAVLKLRNPNNKSIASVDIAPGNSDNLRLGDQITTYGYPAKFGTKITYTSGDFSGVDGNYIKTTAIIEHGNSGGGAYLKNGTFVGIPTAVVKGDLNSMGYVLSINKINNFVNNSAIANNSGSNNNYSRVSSVLENIDLNTLNSLNLFIASNETGSDSQKVIAEEKKLVTKIDNNLSKRVNGKILLQVEKNGEGWYVYPDDKKKYYLGRPADAFNIMRNLGLGIKHSELASYLNAKFPSRLSGKIMLDVEQNGEAYYINPNDLKGYYLNRPSDAFRIMRALGLGITNNDIRKIGVGEVK